MLHVVYYSTKNKISMSMSILWGTKSYVFYSGRIRTLVAMATYSSHRLIMGKVEICIFFCLNEDIWNFFLQKCLLSSPLCFI